MACVPVELHVAICKQTLGSVGSAKENHQVDLGVQDLERKFFEIIVHAC